MLPRSISTLLVLGAGGACTAPREPSPSPPVRVTEEGQAEASNEPRPIAERDPEESAEELPDFVSLDVPGFQPAVVSLPRDLSRPRPCWVAAHGAGDGPTWQCALWRELLDARAFVLCPAGVPFGKSPEQGYFFRNHHELEREVLAAVDALHAAFPGRVDVGSMVYAGYSQGATMGALMLREHGERFPRIALIEGGYSEWNMSVARKFGASGGERVLFACGIRSCKNKADRSAAWVEQAGLRARVEYAEGAGHTYGGAVAVQVKSALPWLIEGDERWR